MKRIFPLAKSYSTSLTPKTFWPNKPTLPPLRATLSLMKKPTLCTGMPASVNVSTLASEGFVVPPIPAIRAPYGAGFNLRLSSAALAALSMLKKAPVSTSNRTSSPFICASISGVSPSMVTGNSAIFTILHAASAGMLGPIDAIKRKKMQQTRPYRQDADATNIPVMSLTHRYCTEQHGGSISLADSRATLRATHLPRSERELSQNLPRRRAGLLDEDDRGKRKRMVLGMSQAVGKPAFRRRWIAWMRQRYVRFVPTDGGGPQNMGSQFVKGRLAGDARQ